MQIQKILYAETQKYSYLGKKKTISCYIYCYMYLL